MDKGISPRKSASAVGVVAAGCFLHAWKCCIWRFVPLSGYKSSFVAFSAHSRLERCLQEAMPKEQSLP